MQFLSVVQFDMLLNHLRQLVHALSKLDTSVSDGSVHSHHFVLFGFVDDVDLLHALNLLHHVFIALGS